MSAMFSNVFLIVVLQVVVILFAFFLPEILFRITKKQMAWHVLVASFFLIFSVIFLTLLYSSNLSGTGRVSEDSPQAVAVPPEYTLRIGLLPLQLGTPMDLQLVVYNNGPDNEFTCSLDFLDKKTGRPLDEKAYELVSEQDRLRLKNGQHGICRWNVVFHASGVFLADAFVQGEDIAPTNHEQVALTVMAAKQSADPGFAQNVQQPAPSETAPSAAPQAAPAAVSTAAQERDATVWIYYTRDEATDGGLVEKLKEHNYDHAVAKGKWKTRSESQFLFHRTPNTEGVPLLRKALGLDDVEVYYFDEQRVGKKIKATFNDNPDLDFLVIAR